MTKQRFILEITRFEGTEPYTAKELEAVMSDTFCGVTRASEVRVLDIQGGKVNE